MKNLLQTKFEISRKKLIRIIWKLNLSVMDSKGKKIKATNNPLRIISWELMIIYYKKSPTMLLKI